MPSFGEVTYRLKVSGASWIAAAKEEGKCRDFGTIDKVLTRPTRRPLASLLLKELRCAFTELLRSKIGNCGFPSRD